MNSLLRLYSLLPNWRGKLFFGNKIFEATGTTKGTAIQSLLHKFSMELRLSDRMQRIIYIKRCHEPETTTALIPFLKNTRCFIDVGANVGYFSLLAKACNSECHVVSIEPLPQNLKQLHTNKRLNGFESKFDVFDICISDTQGTTEFLIPPDEECGWGRIAYKDLFDGHRIERRIDTLDRFVEQNKIANVDMIKMDIEGFEMKALQGMHTILSNMQPVICIELNEPCLKDLGTSSAEIFDLLKKYYYNIFYIDTTGALHETENVVENYEYLNYIAIPTLKMSPQP